MRAFFHNSAFLFPALSQDPNVMTLTKFTLFAGVNDAVVLECRASEYFMVFTRNERDAGK